MTKKTSEAAKIDRIEQDFLDALKRLQDGQPTHKSLRASMRQGAVKITLANVALEAGRSRTLIGMENCRYPAIRDRVKDAKKKKVDPPTTHNQLIERLRSEISDLKVQRDLYQAEALAQFIARTKAEKRARKERDSAERLRRALLDSEKVSLLKPKAE